jgi:hypothetical protein
VYGGYNVYNYWPVNGTASTGPAVFVGGNTGGVAAGFRVDINAEQWNALGAVTAGNTGSIYQAAGLLHELGHIYALSSAFGSGGSDIRYDGLPWQGSVSDANQALILKDCFGITSN